MLNGLALFLFTLAVSLLVSVPAYIRLFELLERLHPQEYSKLGRPTITSHSPTISLAVQNFIYTGSRAEHISHDVARQCRFLGVVTPLIVIVMLGQVAWWLFYALRLIG